MRRIGWMVAVAGLAVVGAAVLAAGQETAITIYSTAQPGAISPEMYRPTPQSQMYGNGNASQMIPGYGIVKQERTFEIPEGRSALDFTGVAALIDPTTVRFESLTDPDGLRVLSQSYQFDLVSLHKMLERYIGQTINLNGMEVKLLSVSGGGALVERPDGTVSWQSGYGNVVFPRQAEGLITRPTLVWDLEAETGGEHETRISYETKGITWWADYNLVFAEGENANSGTLDVGAWVSILNQSGGGYEDARLKLIAGDVHRAPEPQYGPYPAMEMRRSLDAAQEGFQEKSFFEYHLYTLGRPATIPDNSTKQIELFEAATGVPAEKVLVYYGLEGFGWFAPNPATDRGLGQQMNTKVDIYLKFRNDEASGLGIPLPSGRIRVSQLDPDGGTLEFIGEDVIDHTPKNEDVLVRMGSAFDIVGERTQENFRVDASAQWMEETIKVTLRNHKDEAVRVLVKENLFRWVNWEILEASHEYEKQDARTVHFPVEVAADGEVTVRYTVRYTW